MEIERKYLIKTLPDNLESYPHHLIEQGYLNTQPVVRIRKQDTDYYLTYKGGGLMAREEYNLPLNEVSYEHLKTKADGNIITKVRYVIPIEHPKFQEGFLCDDDPELKIELDIFSSPLTLQMAEVEFPTIEMANAFIPPAWFGEDVTMNTAYHNSTMSRTNYNQ